MIRLLQFLWTGCWHRWTLFREDKVMGSTEDKRRDWVASDFILRCEKCGDMTKRRL